MTHARRPFRLGLTGGIAMGKSVAAAHLATRGVPVWDADAAVHRLYAPGGAAVGPVTRLFPAARDHAGGIDRAALRAALAADPSGFDRLNAAVHPLLAVDRAAFAGGHPDAPVLAYDIPLLFETGLDADMHGVATISVPPAMQRARALARPGMTAAALDAVLARQWPDADRRALARWIIPGTTPESAAALDAMLADIAAEMAHA